MNVNVEILKDIPKEQINRYEDRVVYNVAVLTREFTKGSRAYPHLTGELERTEIKAPIQNLGQKEYALLRGTDYGKYVYKMTGVHWTNPSTKPQWYETIYRNKKATINSMAQSTALKEIK